MIRTNVKVAPSLLDKLNGKKLETQIESLVMKTGENALQNIKEFGLGVGSVLEPFGGAPHWQGKITVPGHYSGYLSDSHYLRKQSPFHVQIVSSAEFTEGVIEGFSTNWNITFGPNHYHKRAVDKLFTTGLYGNQIQSNWNSIRNNRVSWG